MADEFCGACGRHGRPDDRFCRGCGAALGDGPAEPDPITESASLADRGHLTDAIATVQRAITLGDSADLRVALATLCLRRGDIDAASRELERAVQLDASCAIAHAYAGALLVRRGRVAEAGEALDRALGLAPDDLVVAMKLAEYFAVLGVLERARDELRRGLEDGGGSPDARIVAARMLEETEKRLRGSVTRRPVDLPELGRVGRAVARRRTESALNATRVEA